MARRYRRRRKLRIGATRKKSWKVTTYNKKTGAAIRARSSALVWHGSPFPREYPTQITFSDNVTLTSTSGAPASYLWSINSLYDPNVTGTGGQPRYFDTLCGANGTAAPYYNYRVFASKIRIQAIPTGADALTMRGFIGLGLFNTTATQPSSLSEMRARGDYKTKFIGYWYANNGTCKMKRFMKTKSLFDIKDVKDDNDLVGDYQTSPSKSGRWAVTWVPFDEVTTRSIQFSVVITYYVTFFNRNDVADS